MEKIEKLFYAKLMVIHGMDAVCVMLIEVIILESYPIYLLQFFITLYPTVRCLFCVALISTL